MAWARQQGESELGLRLAGALVHAWEATGYYSEGDKTDPVGPPSGISRVVRGGCWSIVAKHSRAGYRIGFGPGVTYNIIGFRVVCDGAGTR